MNPKTIKMGNSEFQDNYTPRITVRYRQGRKVVQGKQTRRLNSTNFQLIVENISMIYALHVKRSCQQSSTISLLSRGLLCTSPATVTSCIDLFSQIVDLHQFTSKQFINTLPLENSLTDTWEKEQKFKVSKSMHKLLSNQMCQLRSLPRMIKQ